MLVLLTMICWISSETHSANCDIAKVTNFVTDKLYGSMVLDASGRHVRGESLTSCGFQCMRQANCVSFAINSSPEVRDCILYETNLCDVSNNVALKEKDGYRIYDMDARLPEKQSCLARQDSLKKCLDYVHRFNATSNGADCPSGFSFVGGVCYRVTNQPVNYTDAQNAANRMLGSRLAKLRDKGVQDLLITLLKEAGVPQNISYGIWVGARNNGNGSSATADWRWEDGTAFNVSDTKGFLMWRKDQPDYSKENNVVMGPPDFCWNDVPFNVVVKTLCQAPSTNKRCPSKFTQFPNNNVCYKLLPAASPVWDAPNRCSSPSSGGIVKTFDEWKFIIEMIKNTPLANESFSTGFKYSANSSDFVSVDVGQIQLQPFGQWCAGQPDHIPQACLKFAFDSSIDDQFCSTEQGYATEWIASSCSEWYQLGHRSNGLFRVLPAGTQVDIQVYCDMTTDGGGWTIIQARPGNSGTTFLRDITEYINGFGDAATDFWLGLDQIVLLTSQEMVNLMLTFEDDSGRNYVIKYINFQLSNNSDSPYTFTVGNFETASGVSDELSKQQNVPFSVDSKKGGWWFASGSTVNFNGAPISNGVSSATAMQWSPDLLIKNTALKIKSSTLSECLDNA